MLGKKELRFNVSIREPEAKADDMHESSVYGKGRHLFKVYSYRFFFRSHFCCHLLSFLAFITHPPSSKQQFESM